MLWTFFHACQARPTDCRICFGFDEWIQPADTTERRTDRTQIAAPRATTQPLDAKQYTDPADARQNTAAGACRNRPSTDRTDRADDAKDRIVKRNRRTEHTCDNASLHPPTIFPGRFSRARSAIEQPTPRAEPSTKRPPEQDRRENPNETGAHECGNDCLGHKDDLRDAQGTCNFKRSPTERR